MGLTASECTGWAIEVKRHESGFQPIGGSRQLNNAAAQIGFRLSFIAPPAEMAGSCAIGANNQSSDCAGSV